MKKYILIVAAFVFMAPAFAEKVLFTIPKKQDKTITIAAMKQYYADVEFNYPDKNYEIIYTDTDKRCKVIFINQDALLQKIENLETQINDLKEEISKLQKEKLEKITPSIPLRYWQKSEFHTIENSGKDSNLQSLH